MVCASIKGRSSGSSMSTCFKKTVKKEAHLLDSKGSSRVFMSFNIGQKEKYRVTCSTLYCWVLFLYYQLVVKR